MIGRKTQTKTLRALFAGVCAVSLLWAQPAAALDAPKWVAAMYMEAQTQVGLRWLPVPGATGYKLLRSTTAGKDYQEVAAPAVPQHFDTGVTPGTTYYYVIQAVAGAEASPNSPEKAVVVTQAVKSEPPALKLVEMDQNAAGIRVQWGAIGGAVAYNIYRRESFKPAGKEDLVGSVAVADPYLDKTNLKKGIEYIYSVSALDSSFNETAKSTSMGAKFTPKEEKKKSAKKEEKVVDNRKVTFLGSAKYVPGEVATRGKVNVAVMAHCDGDLYVLYATGEILVYNDAMNYTRRIVGGGEGKYPKNLTSFVCGFSEGELLGVSLADQKVVTFSSRDGALISEFLVTDGLDPKNPLDEKAPRPYRAAWKDDEVFVNDSNNHLIRVFSKRGKLLRRIGGFGLKAGEFSFPADIVFTKEGEMAVLEAANARVQIFDKDEKSKLMFGESGKRVGQFARAAGLAYDPAKKLYYIGDFLSSVVHVWNPDGTVAGVIKMADPATERGFNSVSHVFFGKNGVLYSADYGLSEVLAMKDDN